MRNNTSTRAVVDRTAEEVLGALERLPRQVRFAIIQSAFNIDCVELLGEYLHMIEEFPGQHQDIVRAFVKAIAHNERTLIAEGNLDPKMRMPASSIMRYHSYAQGRNRRLHRSRV